jgi:hypothetical protein
MATYDQKSRLRLLSPIPLAVGLVIAFFMPWLSVSCDPGEVGRSLNSPQAAEINTVGGVAAQASGYAIAEGRLNPTKPSAEALELLTANDSLLKHRPWLYLCLLVPVLIAAIALIGYADTISPGAAGKLVQVLSAAGLAIVLYASTFNYVSDAGAIYRQRRGADAEAASDDAATVKAQRGLRQLVTTRPTRYLWGTVGLYGMSIAAGLLACGAPRKKRLPAWQVDAPEVGRQPAPPPPGPLNAPEFGPELTSAWTPQRTQQK